MGVRVGWGGGGNTSGEGAGEWRIGFDRGRRWGAARPAAERGGMEWKTETPEGKMAQGKQGNLAAFTAPLRRRRRCARAGGWLGLGV